METKSRETGKRLHIRVTGRVQGVYFRASTCGEARRLGISGWVRNTSDGAVELEAQGAPDALAELVAWCHEGPPAARVQKVETREIALAPESPAGARFDVRR